MNSHEKTKVKKCSKCGQVKLVVEFHRDKSREDGLRTLCKICAKAANSRWRKNNLERARAATRLWQKNNPEKERAATLLWRKNNLERARAVARLWKKNNHRRMCAVASLWKKNNPEKVRAAVMKKRATLRGRLNHCMCTGVRSALRYGKAGKSWELLVGFGFFELKKRLKKTMPEGYTWQDFMDGKLHIDHKVPISVFNFNKPEHADFQRCWALSNLQLLPARDNLRKSSKLQKPFQPSFQI